MKVLSLLFLTVSLFQVALLAPNYTPAAILRYRGDYFKTKRESISELVRQKSRDPDLYVQSKEASLVFANDSEIAFPYVTFAAITNFKVTRYSDYVENLDDANGVIVVVNHFNGARVHFYKTRELYDGVKEDVECRVFFEKEDKLLRVNPL